MRKDTARISALLPGKVVLIIITTTAVTGGFTLGYFVGRSVSPASEPSILKESTGNDLASVPVAPNPSFELKNEASSSPLPQMEPSPPQSTQASAPPAFHGATPLAADMRNEEKINPKSQKAAMTEKKIAPGTGEQSSPPVGVSNQDKGTRNTSDLQTSVKSTSAQSTDSSHRKVVYTVQAAAFKQQKDADILRQTLEGKGYKVFTKKEPGPKGVTLFKVRVGEFEQKKDASVFAVKLKKMDGLNAFAVVKD